MISVDKSVLLTMHSTSTKEATPDLVNLAPEMAIIITPAIIT